MNAEGRVLKAERTRETCNQRRVSWYVALFKARPFRVHYMKNTTVAVMKDRKTEAQPKDESRRDLMSRF